MQVISPAKLNLFLQVLRKREDGYHEIYTLFQKITLYDDLEIELTNSGFSLRFDSETQIPVENNLIFKAWTSFSEKFSPPFGVRVYLKKRIPIGAGLGGGSSNAGTFLRVLGEFLGIDQASLIEIGSKLGADVPFFIQDFSTAIGRGKGELLTPYPSYEAYYILIYPGFSIDTGWAYRALNLTKSKNPVYYEASIPPWKNSQGLINDFRGVLYSHYPVYETLERMLLETGALAVNISGSGSTIYGVYESPPLKAYAELSNKLKKMLRGGKIYLVRNL